MKNKTKQKTKPTVSYWLSKSTWADCVMPPVQQKVLYPEDSPQDCCKLRWISVCEVGNDASSPRQKTAFSDLMSGMRLKGEGRRYLKQNKTQLGCSYYKEGKGFECVHCHSQTKSQCAGFV